MKRFLLPAALVLGLGLISCDRNDPVEKPAGDLVDVEINSGSQDSKTRTIVSPSGATRWAKSDQVTIMDVDGTPRPFIYMENYPQSIGRFKGQLLGGNGLRTYYAYYASEDFEHTLNADYDLTLTRHDLNISENGELTTAFFGKHCPMVAVPITFDANDYTDVHIEFHHVACLIEASISSDPDDAVAPLRDVNFNRVVFEINDTQSGLSPFNTVVKVNLKAVKGKPTDEVEIPFTDVGDKGDKMSTSLTYKSTQNLGTLIDASGIGCYSIPIFALPTKADAKCEIDVTFYQGEAVVCKLHMRKGFNGLNPAGLNVLNFNKDHIELQ